MNAYRRIHHGFDPVFDERSRVLVLGSFPSVLSRENAFYYGNPAQPLLARDGGVHGRCRAA